MGKKCNSQWDNWDRYYKNYEPVTYCVIKHDTRKRLRPVISVVKETNDRDEAVNYKDSLNSADERHGVAVMYTVGVKRITGLAKHSTNRKVSRYARP